MKFETIKDNKKRIGITLGIVGVILIVGVTAFTLTRASYKQTQSVPLLKGNISYNKSDLEIVAIKLQQDDGTYTDATEIPSVGYKLNTDITKSYCKVGTNTNKVNFKYIDNVWYIGTKDKGSKCYLLFDKGNPPAIDLVEDIIASNGGRAAIKAKGNPDFSKLATTDEGMYAMEDDDGVSYYFRGAVTNNYVKFGKHASNYSDSAKAGKDMYWRIIRINGDGTIRLIYDGSEYHSNGTRTNDNIAVSDQQFANSGNNNAYVGYTYALGSKRGTGTDSNIKTKLEEWYASSGLSNYSNYLADSGFCGDRTSTTTKGEVPNNTGGTGLTTTYYGAYYRLIAKKEPTLKCATINYGSGETGNKLDLYTVKGSTKGNARLIAPIGLISADEVSIAGGMSEENYTYGNGNYYLFNGNYYWSMSPYAYHYYNSNIGYEAREFYVGNDGELTGGFVVTSASDGTGLRPVINIDPTKINNVTIDSNGVYVIS